MPRNRNRFMNTASIDVASASGVPSSVEQPSEIQSTDKAIDKRTSHARKRPKDYIPRPPNAFILFRSDFVKKGVVPQEVESHASSLSVIAAGLWKSMSSEDQAPWFERAQKAKEEHLKMNPGYAYRPTDSYTLSKRRKITKGKDEEEIGAIKKRCAEVVDLLKNGKKGEELQKDVEEIDKKFPRKDSKRSLLTPMSTKGKQERSGPFYGGYDISAAMRKPEENGLETAEAQRIGSVIMREMSLAVLDAEAQNEQSAGSSSQSSTSSLSASPSLTSSYRPSPSPALSTPLHLPVPSTPLQLPDPPTLHLPDSEITITNNVVNNVTLPSFSSAFGTMPRRDIDINKQPLLASTQEILQSRPLTHLHPEIYNPNFRPIPQPSHLPPPPPALPDPSYLHQHQQHHYPLESPALGNPRSAFFEDGSRRLPPPTNYWTNNNTNTSDSNLANSNTVTVNAFGNRPCLSSYYSNPEASFPKFGTTGFGFDFSQINSHGYGHGHNLGHNLGQGHGQGINNDLDINHGLDLGLSLGLGITEAEAAVLAAAAAEEASSSSSSQTYSPLPLPGPELDFSTNIMEHGRHRTLVRSSAASPFLVHSDPSSHSNLNHSPSLRPNLNSNSNFNPGSGSSSSSGSGSVTGTNLGQVPNDLTLTLPTDLYAV